MSKLSISSGQTLKVIPGTDLQVRLGKKFTRVPDGSYLARVVEIELVHRYKKPTYDFHFVIVEGPHQGETLRGFVPGGYDSYSSFTKLWSWYAAISKEVPEGDVVDLGIFHGKVLKVKVEAAHKSRKTKNIFSNVVEVEGVHSEL